LKKITFPNRDRTFFQTLHSRVRQHFRETGKNPNANAEMGIKTGVFLVLLFSLYALLVWGGQPWYVNLGLCVLMGLTQAGVGFNIMHDAAHGSYSSNKRVNALLAFSLDLIGGSSTLWRTKHNVVHHTYTNIPGEDGDVEQEAVIRLTPEQPLWKVHRYQHIYSTFLYGLLSLTWIYFSDFEKIVKKKVANYPVPPLSRAELTTLFGFKISHVLLALVLPSFFNPFWAVLGCYLLVQAVLGVVLALVFQLAHVYEHAAYPMPDPDSLVMENEWAKHQVMTTANFGTGNRLLNWYVGGLNFQVEHHLFPHICHVHYPKLNPIVRQTCEEFNVPYREFPSFGSALTAHYRQLYRLGRGETVQENESEQPVRPATIQPAI
jgi:linoleoyl-CoA desaturase